MNSKITLAICNFNTTEYTNQCISSFIQTNFTLNNIKFIILDNSNITKFSTDHTFVKIIDNTNEKYINFSKILYNSNLKLTQKSINNYASLKHAMSIQFLLNICTTQYLLLCDSDIIFNHELDYLFDIDEHLITIADIQYINTYSYEDVARKNILNKFKTRFIPYIQLFNIDLIKKYHIKYLDYTRIHGLNLVSNSLYYDTGASFYEDVLAKKLQYKRIDYHSYITHCGQGSWKKEYFQHYN